MAIAGWESETKLHPLVALAAPKNVQDAILADSKRAAVVDIIAFRYWWQTDKDLFAPNGGENLSPRQFQRQFWLHVAALAGDWKHRLGTFRPDGRHADYQ